ncbi:MAG TPA: ABC transporter permease [Gammaproteobacteria bacterium]|nr:ABC transporter permease [Gammaproteobacteria bacterium]
MKYLGLVASGLKRKKLRTLFTFLSVLVAFLLFGLLAATRAAFTGGTSVAGQHRLVTMSKVSLTQSLPLAYLQRIQTVPGVEDVTWEIWFGGYYQDPKQSIFSFAVNADNYFAVYSELRVPPSQLKAWKADRAGAMVGASLARRFGWKVGDKIPLKSNIWRDANGNNTWTLTIDGIYSDRAQGGNDQMLFLHYKYWNERSVFADDMTSLYVLRIAPGANAAVVADKIDALFANSPHETRTSTEEAFVQNFADQLGDIGAIVTAIVGAVFFGMLLVTANTMARAVRERTSELAVMKALGFRRAMIVALVVGESVVLTALGGLAGLGLAWLLATGIGTRLSRYVPGFAISTTAALVGIGFIVLLGLLSAVLPCAQVLRMNMVSALRKA